jgi:sulfur-oxidizing protein SoxY
MSRLRSPPVPPPRTTRRRALVLAAGAAGWVIVRPALAQPDELAAAIATWTGGAPVRTGKVRVEIAQLVDNGNTVPLTVSVDHPMTEAEHVSSIAVFNQRNPQREVATFTLGPRAGKAQVATRVRLATSQKLVAVARLSDGSYWSQAADVIVTLAACIEGET